MKLPRVAPLKHKRYTPLGGRIKRNNVTIALGLLTSGDGLVVAADTQMSYGGEIKGTDTKIACVNLQASSEEFVGNFDRRRVPRHSPTRW